MIGERDIVQRLAGQAGALEHDLIFSVLSPYWSQVTTNGILNMATVSLKDAKAGFSNLVDEAIKGEFVTITRHGKPVAALVSIAAAEAARRALGKSRPGLVAHLKAFPVDIEEFERNPASSRDVDL